MAFKSAIVTIVAISAVLVHSAPINSVKLKYRLAARGCLPDKDNGTLTDNENPDWGDILELDFDRSENPRWHFKVHDQDNGRKNGSGVKVYVDVADYVDKNQHANVHLSKIGCPIISAVDPVTHQTGEVLNTPAASAAVGQSPAPVTTQEAPAVAFAKIGPDVLKLRFKVSGRDLPEKDNLGLTDHFVELYYTENGSTKETKFGKSATINDTNNPDWEEVFEFDYDRIKNQKWLLRVYNHDQSAEEYPAGKVWIDVNDYVAKGQKLTSNLRPKGTLNITTVDSPKASPVDSPKASPVDSPKASPVDSPTASPVNSPTASPVDSPTASPVDSPKASPVDSPKASPVDSPTASPVNSPTASPVDSPTASPVDSPTASPVDSPTASPVLASQETQQANRHTIEQTTVGSPEQNAVGNLEQTTVGNLEQTTVGSLEQTSVGGLEQTTVGGPEPTTVGSLNQSQLVVDLAAAVPFVELPVKLKFKLSANGLDNKDVHYGYGTSDPFVNVTYKQDDTPSELFVGQTEIIESDENPRWKKVFEFTYDKNKKPKWHFLIMDDDNLPLFDVLDDVWVDVAEYVQKNQNLDVKLKKGTFFIRNAA